MTVCGAAYAAAPSPFAKLEFRSIGPTTGRIDAVAGVPGNSQTYYAGGLGGLWLTTDGGVTWQPIFDKQPVTSIGAIAVAPSNPKIVYVGTGEPNIRNDIAFGDGVWRSDDGGKNWRHLGLDGTSQIAQIAVNPRNPDVAYVAAVGDPFSPGTNRGVYVTRDGGKHWARSLYTGPTTGASTVAISRRTPRTSSREPGRCSGVHGCLPVVDRLTASSCRAMRARTGRVFGETDFPAD